MSKIEELIEKLCPDGVEFRSLGSFCKINTGKGITNKDTMQEGMYPVVSGGIQPMGYFNSYNREENTITIARAGTAGFVNYIKTKFYLNDKCFSVIPKDETCTKFLYYFLKNIEDKIMAMKSTGSVPTVNTEKVSSIVVPNPPMEIQSEIVKILDNFTKLTAELTAELTERKQQYEYYRDSLLSFEQPEIKWLAIEDLFNIKGGYTPSKDNNEFWNNGTIDWFRLEDINKNGRVLYEANQKVTELAVKKSGLFKENSLIITTSATIGEYALIKVPFLCNQRFTCLTIKDEYSQSLMPEFMLHYAYKLSAFCKEHLHIGNFASVDMTQFNKFKFPIPTLDVQERIVNVLDNFDAICSDLKIGLPAEIDARQKQYEYYREKLLTFDFKPDTLLIEKRSSAATCDQAQGLIRLLQYVYGFATVKVKDIFTRLKGTAITAGKMHEIASENGEIRVFAGGKTVIDAHEEDIPNANITRIPAVLVQSRGVIDFIYYDKPFTFKSEMWAYTIDNKTTLRYLYYVLKHNAGYFRDSASGMGSLPQISLAVTEDFEIKLPCIKEQERIVSILDKFDAIVNDLSNGLPAEIEARQKQYEYYREKLLTFKKKV